eukprot:15215470-Alexandrium_andersonii.AAC.1
MASNLVPEAPEGCVLCRSSAQTPNLPTKAGVDVVRTCELVNSQAPTFNPPIRNPRNPLRLVREKPDQLNTYIFAALHSCWTA